jgi:transcriptional regulator with XRE-family HTH domain
MINRALTKKLMRAGNWTYEALSAATHMDLGNLYRILAGLQEPRVSTAICIAKCLEVSVENLFQDRNPDD